MQGQRPAWAILFSAALSIHHVYGVIGRTIDKINAAVLAVEDSNVAEVYRGVRKNRLRKPSPAPSSAVPSPT